VSANPFEWSWPSVAGECKSVLGPAGYGSVQVALPEDSLTIPQNWYDVYQPADYNLKGWIAVNNESTPQTHAFTTGLPAGTYCDVIHANPGACAGHTVTVDAQGIVSVTVPAKQPWPSPQHRRAPTWGQRLCPCPPAVLGVSGHICRRGSIHAPDVCPRAAR
jgi:hypothetical protein